MIQQDENTFRIEEGRIANGIYKGYLAQSPKREDKVQRTDAEWTKILTQEEYRIMREEGTERAFCSGLLNMHEDGMWYVKGTKHPVCKTTAKFDSGPGGRRSGSRWTRTRFG